MLRKKEGIPTIKIEKTENIIYNGMVDVEDNEDDEDSTSGTKMENDGGSENNDKVKIEKMKLESNLVVEEIKKFDESSMETMELNINNVMNVVYPIMMQRYNSQTVTLALEKIMFDKFNEDAWKDILNEIMDKPIDEVRYLYDQFFELFPTAGKYWKDYADREIEAKNYTNAENIFRKSLEMCPNIHLWNCYLNYVVKIVGQKPNTMEHISKAYEFSLSMVGKDISSNQIWMDYINFVQQQKIQSQTDEELKLNVLRRLYTNALTNPMHKLEDIRTEYEKFENNVNPNTAKQYLIDLDPKFNLARSTYREKKNYLDGISRNALALPPKINPKDQEQARLWKRLLRFEKKKSQRIRRKRVI